MDEPRGLELLTPSEKITLRLLGECMSTREIAEHLALSPRTVENRRCSIAQKLSLPGGRGLQRVALELRDLL